MTGKENGGKGKGPNAGRPAAADDMAKLRTRYPLPDDVKDAVVNRDDLAKAFAKSPNTIDAWRKAGMPVLEEGGNGKAYQFQLSDCWAWYSFRRDQDKAERRAAEESVNQLRLALQADDQFDEYTDLTPEERRREYEASLAYARAAEAQGNLTQASEVAMHLHGLHALTRNFILGFPDEIERQLALKPEQTDQVAKICNRFLEGYRQTLANSNLVTDPKVAVK